MGRQGGAARRRRAHPGCCLSSNDPELRRLTEVYEGYARSAEVQGRWDEANAGNRAIAAERRAAMGSLLQEQGLWPLASRRVLEVGCGGGKTLADLLALGADSGRLYGVDMLPDRVAEARSLNPGVRVDCGNAERLDFGDGELDVVVVFTVFTSILDDAIAARVADEITRVLRRGGGVLWYDFRYRNPNNPNVRGLSAADIRALFPALRPVLRPLTLLPPLARRLGSLTSVLYPLLARVPLLRGHYLGLLLKP